MRTSSQREPQLWFSSEVEFDKFWASKGRPTSMADRDRLIRVAHFVAGATLRDGFHLFINGGQPLLERRTGDLIEEIIFKTPPYRSDGKSTAVALCVHASHRRFRDLRMDYWTPPSRAPLQIANGNLGALARQGAYTAWQVNDGVTAHESMVDAVFYHAMPWFARFHSMESLMWDLAHQQLPLVDWGVSLELVLLLRGELEAAMFAERLLQAHPEHRPEVTATVRALIHRRLSPDMEGGSLHRFAVVAARFYLLPV